jgi:hypothetical protein
MARQAAPAPAPVTGPVVAVTLADVTAAVLRWRKLSTPEFRDLLDAPTVNG